MDFSLTEEQRAFQESVREFARREVRPAEKALDKLSRPEEVFHSPLFWDVLRKGYQLGYHKLMLPESVGGLGITDPLFQVLMLEELAYGGAGLASTFLVAPMGFIIISMLGVDRNPELTERYLRPFARENNERFLSAWALTEPNVGSDCFEKHVPGLRFNTTARRDGDHYIINGAKAAWVSNGSLAQLYLVHACLEPDKGMEGTGMFLVPRDLPGVSVGRPLDKLGLRVLNQAEVFFDEVRVPKSYLYLPPSRMYHGVLEAIVSAGNLSVAALAVGIARAAYEEALAYAKQRLQGGRPIIRHPNVGLKLFDAYARIEAARYLVYKAVWKSHDLRARTLKYAAAARWTATRWCMEITEEMIQLMGASGICRECNLEKYFRDAKMLKIMDGTIERIALNAVPLL